MNAVAHGEGDGEGWVRRYEDMRREVLYGQTFAKSRWGLALVVRRGLVAWMRAQAKRTLPVSCFDHRPPGTDAGGTRDAGPVRTQMIIALANMILNVRRETTV